MSARERFDGFLLGRMVEGVISKFASSEKIEEISSFFASQNTDGVKRSVEQGIEAAQILQKWIARESDSVAGYLAEKRKHKLKRTEAIIN